MGRGGEPLREGSSGISLNNLTGPTGGTAQTKAAVPFLQVSVAETPSLARAKQDRTRQAKLTWNALLERERGFRPAGPRSL